MDCIKWRRAFGGDSLRSLDRRAGCVREIALTLSCWTSRTNRGGVFNRHGFGWLSPLSRDNGTVGKGGPYGVWFRHGKLRIWIGRYFHHDLRRRIFKEGFGLAVTTTAIVA